MTDRLHDLQRAMRLIAHAVESLPENCRDVAANALLNIAAEAVVEDVGCAEAGRIFARLADHLHEGRQPPASGAVSLSGFDA
ncbi:hypothetical protein [Enhydrobacter aerosaccus]|nr:hypothetical protein [Enhydrobacter aerosaccus]